MATGIWKMLYFTGAWDIMGDKESYYMKKFERYIFYLLLAAYIGVFLFYHDGEYHQIISGIIMLVLALTSLYFALCYKMG